MKRLIILFLMVILVTILGASEKIGLALSGGGARGFAHIGMLKVIDDVGLPVDAVSGTSIGAVIGALYSMGYSAAEIESLCVSVDWKQLFDDSINREDLSVSQKRWAPYGNFYFSINRGLIPEIPSGFIPGQRIDELMFRLFYRASDISNFNDLPIPFRCVATNLITGEEKTFSSGSLSEAVRASMSIPSIFQPYRMDGQLYIDGGISQNLPADLLVDMGVNHCIGLKVNSKLRDKDDLTNIIKVLDQTINIGITTKVNQVIDECGILIEPDLSEYNSMDFDKIEEIIVAGEKAAREHIDRLRELASLRKTEPYEKPKLVETSEKLGFERIDIKGNQYLSSSKVKEYLGMNTTKSYTSNQILRHAEDAFNFELFDNIYPTIRKSDHGRILEIHVNEKARKSLALNFTYNQDDKLTAGVVFKCTNLLQKNSKLLAEIKLGGKQSLNVDYAKNFGNNWGVYFRLFPYIEESKLYFYNDEHEKTGSVRSLEYGSTGGVGLFARKFMIVEGYAFTYNTRLYRDISYEEVSGKDFTSSGLGLKFYHESLDDYIFPMKGSQFLAKLSVAEKGVASDATYKKFRMTFRTGIPVLPSISVFYRFEYGSYFKQMDVVQFDPFYIGGMDNFLGYQRSEISAPFYKINTFTLRVEPIRNLFCEYRLAGLNYADSDIWKPFQNLVFGGGAVLGYRSHFGPVRIGAGLTEDRSMNYFLSIGYDYDIFMFSRR